MVEETDLTREQIKALQEYIRLLEKINGVSWGWGLNATERSILNEVEHRVSRWTPLLASAAGIGVFVIGLVLARVIARSPLPLVIVLCIAFLAAIGTVILVYRRARRQVVQLEIQKTQLEIFRLEDRLNE